jgi:hemin uptake protein HemP
MTKPDFSDGVLPQKDGAAPPAALPPLVLTSEEVFQGRREILIEHGGEMYRLRITSRGRLILTK